MSKFKFKVRINQVQIGKGSEFLSIEEYDTCEEAKSAIEKIMLQNLNRYPYLYWAATPEKFTLEQ